MYAYPALDELLEEARDIVHVDTATLEEMAALALELAAIHTAVEKALEPLKDRIRHDAREHLTGDDGTVLIEGHPEGEDESLGQVTVTYPPHQVKLPRSADLSSLKRDLGPFFSDYFEEVTTYKPHPDFRERIKAAMGANRADPGTALAAVQLISPTPRVGFKPAGVVGPERS